MDLSIPDELKTPPLAPVAFVGLTQESDIFKKFALNRGSDRLPIRILPGDHLSWPVMKPKRTTYDWFIPKGILKKNWMKKHLFEVPSVVAIFFELDWNAKDFHEKKKECASKVQTVRSALAGRSTKLVVVLIQKEVGTFPDSQDVAASERASSLCSECELSNRSLFALPIKADNLKGFIMRLENAFFELAQNYYHQELRTVKSHRDSLNKTTHLYLFVRHQFKAGFLNEMKRDLHAAHKHYLQAYSFLMEVRATDANILEVKTVAGFITYKICQIAFKLNLPRDAISNFRKHMDIFLQKIGPDELMYEHQGWQSKQYEFFAEIFAEANQSGLPAIQTQHPGLYFQQAAQYAIAQRDLLEEQTMDLQEYPTPDPLENMNQLEFFGQRPWRPGNVALEPPNPSLERMGILALLQVEKKLDHSTRINDLLDKAILQFRKFHSVRSETHLTVTKAEELKNVQKYREALQLLEPIISHYRSEKWRSLLDAVLQLSLKCAFLLGDASNYLKFGLELASKLSSITPEEKERIAQNISNILQGKLPDAEQGTCSKTDLLGIESANKKWNEWFKSKEDTIVNCDSGISCYSARANFKNKVAKANERVMLKVSVINETQHPILLSRVEVTTLDDSRKLHWEGSEEVKEVWSKSLDFLPDQSKIKTAITVREIAIRVGEAKPVTILLQQNFSKKPFEDNLIIPRPQLLPGSVVEGGDFTSVSLTNAVYIEEREPKMEMSISHMSPALVGEWYPVVINIQNKEHISAENVRVKASLVEAFDLILADTTRISFDPDSEEEFAAAETPLDDKKQHFIGETQLNPIASMNQKNLTVFVKSSTVGNRSINIELLYDVLIEEEMRCASTLNEIVQIEALEPFALESKLLSKRLRPIDRVQTDEMFVISPMLKSNAKHELEIAETSLELRIPFVHFNGDPDPSQLSGCVMYPGSRSTECFSVVVHKKSLLNSLDVQNLMIGKYLVKWRRRDQRVTTTCLELSSAQVYIGSLMANVRLPAFGIVRTPMVMTLTLQNTTQKVAEFLLELEPSESFMLSGNKRIQFKILPERKYDFNYVLYPLIAGEKVTLPRPVLQELDSSGGSTSLSSDVNEVIARSISKEITVLPKDKSCEITLAKGSTGVKIFTNIIHNAVTVAK